MPRFATSVDRTDRPGRSRRRAAAATPVALALLTALLLVLPAAAPARAISKPGWLSKVLLTEYFPVPETWFNGRLVSVPGLASRHKVDWLFSARGVSMEGDGISQGGTRVHIDTIGSAGWIGRDGRPGSYYWRAEYYWKNSKGHVTYPLKTGGWSNGAGKKFVPNRGTTFALGASLPLYYYRSIATDRSLIPRNSRVYIPAYKAAAYHGWMCAVDTGGAINGRHIDVYRPAPKEKFGSGYSTPNQPVYVVPPGKRRPKGAPKMSADPC